MPRQLPKGIRCPVCDRQHFFVRQETKKFIEDNIVYIQCQCGVLYKVTSTATNKAVITTERNVYANQ